jgi:3-hydroxyacyl-[acyl-carrier-protein] dehydratase
MTATTTPSEAQMPETPAPDMRAFDIQAILSVLPHRYPFLLIDRIVRMAPDGAFGVAVKNVTVNEPQFTGHFPNRPIYPGVLQIEGMAQAAVAITMLSGTVPAGKLIYFATLDGVKFRKPVVPGDVLEFHMTRVARKRSLWFFRGEARVDGKVVSEADLSAAIADA